MSINKISYSSRGNVYIINGYGDGDGESGLRELKLVNISRKSLRNALQEFGFNVMCFKGPRVFLHEFQFLQELKLALPAVLLFDTRLHDWSGVTLQFDLNQLEHAVPVIFLGGNDDSKEVVTAMKQGAVDFLAQPFTLQEMCKVIEKAMALNVVDAARHLGEHDLKVRLKSLTAREREICFLMARGYGNLEIAALNGSSAGTVKIHRSRVFSKMGVNTLSGLLTQMGSFDRLRWDMVN
jgi:FixJ family two-component response regulator